jgi:hypothetical protein
MRVQMLTEPVRPQIGQARSEPEQAARQPQAFPAHSIEARSPVLEQVKPFHSGLAQPAASL